MNYFVKIAGVGVGVCMLVSACGGNSVEDNQQVTSVQARSLAYSRQAVLAVAGAYLRVGMSVETGVCKDPVFNMVQSTPEQAVINCTVTATGEQPLSIRAANGKLLFSTTVNVPQPQVNLVTSLGSITVELNPAAAPVSVNNFLSYASTGYYNNTLFHRVIAGFVAQGGGYTQGVVKKPGQRAAITLESNNGLLNERNTLAMARTNEPNSATSEFFINLADNRSLDYQSTVSPGYAVFGKVVKGMEVVEKIAAAQTSSNNGFSNVPVTDITILLALQVN